LKVRSLNIAAAGTMNLSIKRVQEELDRQERKRNQEETSRPVQTPTEQEIGVVTEPTKDLTFEEKLKKFMQASDSKNADKRRNTERKQHVRRR
jgi:predicted RNA-binding protein with RPS1 domain